MIGHFIGHGAELGVILLCRSITTKASMCKALGFFAHEFIVEPAVDTVWANGMYSLYTGNFAFPDYKEFSSGIIGSITVSHIVGKISGGHHHTHNHEHNAHHHHHHHHCHNHEHGDDSQVSNYKLAYLLLDSVVSVIGSSMGTYVYSLISGHSHNHEHEHHNQHCADNTCQDNLVASSNNIALYHNDESL